MTEVRAEVSEYVVDALTPECGDWGVWRIKVQRAHLEHDSWTWAVSRHGQSHLRSDDGTWEWARFDPEVHGFPLEDALRLAEQKVWELRVNGKTAAEVICEYYPDLVERIPEHAE